MGENTLGQRVKACREEAGLSQRAVAAKIGITQGALSQLENDRYPSTSYVAQLAKLFGVSPLWLATGQGRKTDAELTDEALEVARNFMRLSRDKQQEIRHYMAIEAELSSQKKRHAEPATQQRDQKKK